MGRDDIIQDWRKRADEWAKKNGIDTEDPHVKAYREEKKNQGELEYTLDNVAEIPKR